MVLIFTPIKINRLIDDGAVIDLNDLFVERRFERTPYYMIVDTKSLEWQLIRNSNHHFGGIDTSVSIAIENDAEIVFASHIGYGAFMGFTNRNLEIYYVSANLSIKLLVEMYNSDELLRMNPPQNKTDYSGKRNKAVIF